EGRLPDPPDRSATWFAIRCLGRDCRTGRRAPGKEPRPTVVSAATHDTKFGTFGDGLVAGQRFEEYSFETSRLFLHHRLLLQTAFQAENSGKNRSRRRLS